MRSQTWNRVVEVICPSCGAKRKAELRGRGTIRFCSRCSMKITKSSADWTITHGESKTLLYRVWNAMKQRCLTPSSQNYERYGGRGIMVCPAWMDFVPFRDWSMANGYTKGLLIDRIDNDGNYSPDNCRWATPIVSALNRPTTKSKVADVAVVKELISLGLSINFIAAFYGMNPRRVSDLKHGKKFYWVTPFVEM